MKILDYDTTEWLNGKVSPKLVRNAVSKFDDQGLEGLWSDLAIKNSNVLEYLVTHAMTVDPLLFEDEVYIQEVRMYDNPDIKPLLQKEFGDTNDCTIVSLTSILSGLERRALGNVKVDANSEIIYKRILDKAKYLYYPSLGTLPMFLGLLARKSVKNSMYHVLLKKSGFAIRGQKLVERIRKSVARGGVFMMTMKHGNFKYYKDHSVVIRGYREFRIKTVGPDGMHETTKQFFIANDNWRKVPVLIDCSLISRVVHVAEFNGFKRV